MFLEDVKLHTKSEPLEIDYYWRILASHFILGTSGNVHFQNYGGELRMSFEASWGGIPSTLKMVEVTTKI